MKEKTKDSIPAISIIMPVYNSEKYLSDTINSVLSQSFTNFELILIDDGSLDRSGIICDEFKQKDERIIVVHQKNQGMCAARNFGLSIASGEYIAFCDNDDKYLDDLLKDNYQLATEHDVNVVRFLRTWIKMKDGKIIESTSLHDIGNHFFKREDLLDNYDVLRRSGGGVWNGLYKKSFIDQYQIRFDEDMRSGYEDLDFNLKVYHSMDTIYLNSKSYYQWIQRVEHSTSKQFKMNYLDALRKCLNSEYDLINNLGILADYPYYWAELLGNTYIYNIYDSLINSTCDLLKSEKMDIIKGFKKEKGFSISLSKEDKKLLKKKNLKAYFVYSLYMNNHLNLLYSIIKLQRKP